MSTTHTSVGLASARTSTGVRTRWWARLQAGDPVLAWYGALLFALMLPAAAALSLDDTLVHGVPAWAKPLKFLASLGLFAWTTAWFAALLSPVQRRSRPWRAVVWTLVACSTLELAYISAMAALGTGSHYNGSTPWHARAYLLMGAGAMALTATQVVLAALLWQDRRHLPPSDTAWHTVAITGLALTFLLGASAGALLSNVQPPAGMGLPLVGWHLTGGDLRPAHFLGLHAQQLVPLGALLLSRAFWKPALVAYLLLWAGAIAIGLDGAVFTPPRVG